jgi:hypothetical protein
MYYNNRPKNALKGGHHNVFSPYNHFVHGVSQICKDFKNQNVEVVEEHQDLLNLHVEFLKHVMTILTMLLKFLCLFK